MKAETAPDLQRMSELTKFRVGERSHNDTAKPICD